MDKELFLKTYGATFAGVLREIYRAKFGKAVYERRVALLAGVYEDTLSRWDTFQERPPVDLQRLRQIAAGFGLGKDDPLFEKLCVIARAQYEADLEPDMEYVHTAYQVMGVREKVESTGPESLTDIERKLAAELSHKYRVIFMEKHWENLTEEEQDLADRWNETKEELKMSEEDLLKVEAWIVEAFSDEALEKDRAEKEKEERNRPNPLILKAKDIIKIRDVFDNLAKSGGLEMDKLIAAAMKRALGG